MGDVYLHFLGVDIIHGWNSTLSRSETVHTVFMEYFLQLKRCMGGDNSDYTASGRW